MSRALALCLLALFGLAAPALAHELRPGYLELKQTSPEAYDVLWKVPAAGTDMRLGIYVRLPDGAEDTSAHRGRFVGGAFIERWSVRHPGGLAGQTIHIDGLGATMTDVLVRVERLDEPFRTTFRVCALEGRDYETAARILGCNKTTVNTRMFRSWRRLRTMMRSA